MLEWPELEVWADSLEDAGEETLGLRLGLFLVQGEACRHVGLYHNNYQGSGFMYRYGEGCKTGDANDNYDYQDKETGINKWMYQ